MIYPTKEIESLPMALVVSSVRTTSDKVFFIVPKPSLALPDRFPLHFCLSACREKGSGYARLPKTNWLMVFGIPCSMLCRREGGGGEDCDIMCIHSKCHSPNPTPSLTPQMLVVLTCGRDHEVYWKKIEGLPGKPQYGAVIRRVHGVTYQTAHRQEINQNALDCNRPYKYVFQQH